MRPFNITLIHQLYYHKIVFSSRGGDSHQWWTLQMFLELSEASCWNVFPPHEEARAATLLAAPTGSHDLGHVTEENLTSRFGSWPSLHWPTRAWATDLRPEGERRWVLATSNAWSLPHTGGIHSLQGRRYSMVDRHRSLTQINTHTHLHVSLHAHCPLQMI